MVTNNFEVTSSVGWIDPSLTVQNLMILKNASTYIRENVENWGWISKNIPYSNRRITRFAILREPYERWLSGFVEDLEHYFVTYFYPVKTPGLTMLENNEANWFFDFLIHKDIYKFDGHADLQYNQIGIHISNLSLDNIVFIKMTDRLGDTLNYWLGTKKVKSYFTNTKLHKRDKNTSIIYQRVYDYFENPKNQNQKERVLDYLKPDYDLYNNVKFVNYY